MYETTTYSVILARMLDRVPDTMDKREGSIIYDAVAPAAMELAQMYQELDVVLNETFADTASREYLIKRAAERGIVPTPATSAILKGVFSIDVPIGARFSLGLLNYVVTEKISTGVFKLQCETAGADGNLHLGALIPVDYIVGLTSAVLTELLIPGEDEEGTDALRARYYDSLESQAFGGNVADYKTKTNVIAGVGGVKVYPAWAGGGTVKLVIMDSTFGVPSTALVTEVQTAIDPVINAGQGKGLAPIGHVVTAAGVIAQSVNVVMTISYQSGYTWVMVQAAVQAALDAYLLELSKAWADSSNLIVRISQIESRMLNVTGILDVTGTTINGVAANLIVPADSIPKRGTVSG